jgi:hypothetical protein
VGGPERGSVEAEADGCLDEAAQRFGDDDLATCDVDTGDRCVVDLASVLRMRCESVDGSFIRLATGAPSISF